MTSQTHHFVLHVSLEKHILTTSTHSTLLRIKFISKNNFTSIPKGHISSSLSNNRDKTFLSIFLINFQVKKSKHQLIRKSIFILWKPPSQLWPESVVARWSSIECAQLNHQFLEVRKFKLKLKIFNFYCIIFCISVRKLNNTVTFKNLKTELYPQKVSEYYS